ncbi:MAG TPA: SDR family oxidoreductase [Actinocrinis sp.]
MRAGSTLITGADGYLGLKLARALLAGSADRLVLAVRAEPGGALSAAKRDRIAGELAELDTSRIGVVAADLTAPDALAGVDPAGITQIIHCAAVTNFNVERDLAERVNVGGTARVAEFADRCPRLRRLAFLSTLYTAGRREGRIPERRHEQTAFVNHYEWSKWAAEEQLWSRFGHLPITSLRLCTLIADDETGAVGQHNAFHNTLKLYYYGLLSLVPGDPATPYYATTTDFTVSAVMSLLDPAAPGGAYHICPDPDAIAPLGTVIDTVFEVFERDERFRRRRLLRPIVCDLDSFDDLVEASKGLRNGPIHDAMDSVSPFATQLFLPKVFGNEALRSAWPGYKAPDAVGMVEATAAQLVRSRWGRGGPGFS